MLKFREMIEIIVVIHLNQIEFKLFKKIVLMNLIIWLPENTWTHLNIVLQIDSKYIESKSNLTVVLNKIDILVKSEILSRGKDKKCSKKGAGMLRMTMRRRAMIVLLCRMILMATGSSKVSKNKRSSKFKL